MQIVRSIREIRKSIGRRWWNSHDKYTFLRSCAANTRVLDVGCGNNAPRIAKTSRPDIHYVGIDIADYNQDDDPAKYADEYIVVPSGEFSRKIASMPGGFDAVISSHNIEHCDDPADTLLSMLRAVAPHGRIFLSFPSQASVHFPHRKGTLNFFDDPTHKWVPDYDEICSVLSSQGFILDFAIKRNRPISLALKGLLAEPRNWFQNRVTPETWALYGFETIIWASRFR